MKQQKKSTTAKKASANQSKRLHERVFESDGRYFLKLVGVFLLGTFWIKFLNPISLGDFVITAIPVGVFLGFILVRILEKHQADRKIWYALLIVIGIISNFQAAGVVV